MRRLLLALAVLVLVAPLAACQSGACGGPLLPALPALTIRSPFELFTEPQSIPGARMYAVPSVRYMAPSFVDEPASACSPALPPSMRFTPGPAARAVDPCNPGGVPQSIPAIR